MIASSCNCEINEQHYKPYNTIITFIYLLISVLFSSFGLIGTIKTYEILNVGECTNDCPEILEVKPHAPHFLVLFVVGIGHVIQLIYLLIACVRFLCCHKQFMAQFSAPPTEIRKNLKVPRRRWFNVGYRGICWIFMIWFLAFWDKFTRFLIIYNPKCKLYEENYNESRNGCLYAVLFGCFFIVIAILLSVSDCCCKIESHQPNVLQNDDNDVSEDNEESKSDNQILPQETYGENIFVHFPRHRTKKQKQQDKKEMRYTVSPELRKFVNRFFIQIFTAGYLSISFCLVYYLFQALINTVSLIEDENYQKQCLSTIDANKPSDDFLFGIMLFCIVIAVHTAGAMIGFIVCNSTYLAKCNSWYKVFWLVEKSSICHILSHIGAWVMSIYLLSFWNYVNSSGDLYCQLVIDLVELNGFEENPSIDKTITPLTIAVICGVSYVVLVFLGILLYYLCWKTKSIPASLQPNPNPILHHEQIIYNSQQQELVETVDLMTKTENIVNQDDEQEESIEEEKMQQPVDNQYEMVKLELQPINSGSKVFEDIDIFHDDLMERMKDILVWHDKLMKKECEIGNYDLNSIQNDYHTILKQFNHTRKRRKLRPLVEDHLNGYQLKCYSKSSCKCVVNGNNIDSNQDQQDFYLQRLLNQIHCYLIHDEIRSIRGGKFTTISQYDENVAASVKQSREKPFIELEEKYNNNNMDELNENKDDSEEHKHDLKENIKSNALKNVGDLAATATWKFGWKYYYHSFFKNNTDVDIYDNIGYKYQDFYVESDFGNFQEEFIEKSDSRKDNWDTAVTKATRLMTTNKCRQIQAKIDSVFQYGNKQYGIKNGAAIKLEHLISVIIYTDYDALQRELKKTYRIIDADNSYKDMIKRHKKFAYWGKYMLEAVEVFGEEWDINKEPDSLFHGIDKTLYFFQSVARFFSPVSTTDDPDVAEHFAIGRGLVLEVKCSDKIKYFECAWVSDFATECEHLLIGGHSPLRIFKIYHISEQDEYDTDIIALNNVQQMMSGRAIIRKTEQNVEVIDAMVKMLQNDVSSLLQYIQNLYKVYCYYVSEVTIDLSLMNSLQFGYFNVLVKDFSGKNKHRKFFSFDNKTVSIMKLCELFVNLKEIKIKTPVIVNKHVSKALIKGLLDEIEQSSASWKKQLRSIRILLYSPYNSAPCCICCGYSKRKKFFVENEYAFKFKDNRIDILSNRNNNTHANDSEDQRFVNFNQIQDNKDILLKVKDIPSKPTIGYCDELGESFECDTFVIDGYRRNFDKMKDKKCHLISLALFRGHNRSIFIWFNIIVTIYYLAVVLMLCYSTEFAA
eukprot:57406_1